MATEAHCAFCFETLAASLEKRRALTLRQVEEYWDKYNADPEEEMSVAEENEDEEMTDGAAGTAEVEKDYKPAAISRLLATPSSVASSASASSSSVTDTSSAPSKASSRTSVSIVSPPRNRTVSHLEGEFPLFVTWNTLSRSGHKSLRGCIGTFEKQELEDGLRSYALTSAFDDSRFPPISIRELPSLEVGVTLLTDFEPAPDPLAWEIGKHGIRISFVYHGRRYGATYLPDVPKEQGWTKEETMISLMRKAGWSGRKQDWNKVADLTVVTYQGKKVALAYREWREWRDWVEEQEV